MIPKGWPVPGLEPHESAAREAFEEAGLVGSAASESRRVIPVQQAPGSWTTGQVHRRGLPAPR